MDTRELVEEMEEIADLLVEEIPGDDEAERLVLQTLGISDPAQIDRAAVLRLPAAVLNSPVLYKASSADVERLLWIRGLGAAVQARTGHSLDSDEIGPALIEENELEDWIREKYEYAHADPLYQFVDWERAALAQRHWFGEVEFEGVTYLIQWA